MKYKFVISGRLNNLNDYTNACRTHRQKGNNMKRKNAQKVLQVIYEQLPRVRIEKPVTVTYTWYEKTDGEIWITSVPLAERSYRTHW